MSWQKCPICGGSGSAGTTGLFCDVCKGEKIINELTGLPPVKPAELEQTNPRITRRAICRHGFIADVCVMCSNESP